MHRYLFALTLTLSFIFTPIHGVFAQSNHPGVETLELQLGAVQSYIARTFGSSTAPMSEDELRDSIQAGIEWFRNAQEPSGHFRYEYAPYRGTYSEEDNIVRQTGALYALGEILRRDRKDPHKVAPIMERSLKYFESLSKDDAFNGSDFRCIARTNVSRTCELGATSLVLTGLIAYADSNASRAREYKSLVEDYASFILAMQKENGGFRSTYRIGKSEQSDKESPFSNGEALLALARYAEYAEGPEIREAIENAFQYLSKQPHDPNLHLWMMAALSTMHKLWGRDVYLAYAEDFTDWRIKDAVRMSSPARNYCAYSEGLSSALSLLKGTLSDEKFASWQNELNVRNRNHLALQLTTADRYRILTQGSTLSLHALRDPKRALGGFLTGDAEPVQRIDFTQHCITGFVHTLDGLKVD